MLLESVIREFQALFRAVRPQITVHAAVHRFAVLIRTCAPGIVPDATPVGLPLKTDHFGNLGPFLGRRLEGSQLRQAARPSPDYRYSLRHLF